MAGFALGPKIGGLGPAALPLYVRLALSAWLLIIFMQFVQTESCWDFISK